MACSDAARRPDQPRRGGAVPAASCQAPTTSGAEATWRAASRGGNEGDDAGGGERPPDAPAHLRDRGHGQVGLLGRGWSECEYGGTGQAGRWAPGLTSSGWIGRCDGGQDARSCGRGRGASSRSGACACSWPARRRRGPPPSPGWRCRAAGRPTRTRARPSRRRSSASTVRDVLRPVAQQRRGHHRHVRADHERLDRVRAAVDAGVAASDTAGPSCGRRMAIQRSGRRSSDGWLSSTRGTTSSVSRSRSGW